MIELHAMAIGLGIGAPIVRQVDGGLAVRRSLTPRDFSSRSIFGSARSSSGLGPYQAPSGGSEEAPDRGAGEVGELQVEGVETGADARAELVRDP
jgi:hypothetical protein